MQQYVAAKLLDGHDHSQGELLVMVVIDGQSYEALVDIINGMLMYHLCPKVL